MKPNLFTFFFFFELSIKNLFFFSGESRSNKVTGEIEILTRSLTKEIVEEKEYFLSSKTLGKKRSYQICKRLGILKIDIELRIETEPIE